MSNVSLLVESSTFTSPQFIYSISTAVCHFPGNLPHMSVRNLSLDTQCFLTGRHEVLAVTIDIHQRVLYMAENKTKSISRLGLDGEETPEIIVGGTGCVEGKNTSTVCRIRHNIRSKEIQK